MVRAGTRALVRPFEHQKDAYPIPELVALGTTPTLAAPFERLIAERIEANTATSDGDVRDLVARCLPDIAGALQAAAFVFDYRLVVPRDPRSWRSLDGQPAPHETRHRADRRPHGAIAQDQPILVDFDGRPVLSLWPLVQWSPPPPQERPRRALLLRRARTRAARA